MANGGRIEYSVGFKADSTSLNNIKNSLKEIKDMSLEALNPRAADYSSHEQAFINLQESAGKLEAALDKAFNKDLGTLNIAKFNKELQKLDLHKIEKDMQAAGTAGVTAFRNIAAQALTTNMQLKQTHTFVDKIATTLSNTIKWNLASSAVNSFTGQVQQAYGYVKNLDSSLNDIRIVTGKANEEMAEFAKLANQTAQDLGKGTVDYTNAALIYYQQGLDEAEVQARAEVTLKAANVTGQSTDEVSEQLTAVWNGYKVSSQEAELYVDKLAAVAATTASDLEELSTGMSKVASAANTMGVDIDQLNAQLATIVSITRQAPESVGTALKTIYARMGDIEAGLDEETTLGNYTQAMADMGFNVLDMNGNLRDMGEVIEEIGSKWTTLSREQQVALSQTVAGTRQYNNLLALFDNWDMYTEALETSADAAGTLQKQQDIYMESTAAHLEKLDAKWEDFYDSILDNNTINKATDLLGGLVDGLTNVVDGLGGGIQTFELLGTVATNILSRKISKGISTFINNIQKAKDNTAQLKSQIETVEILGNINDPVVQKMSQMKKSALDYASIITEERQNEAGAFIKELALLNQQQQEWEESKKAATEYFNKITGGQGSVLNFSKQDIDTSDSVEKTQSLLRGWKEELVNVEKASQGVADQFELINNLNLQISGKKTKAQRNSLNAQLKIAKSEAEDYARQIELFTDGLINNNIVAENSSLELENALKNYRRAIENAQTSGNPFDDAAVRVAAQRMLTVVKQTLPELKQDIHKFENTAKKAWEGIGENFEKQINELNASWSKFTDALKTESGINAVINLTNNFVQLYQLLQSFNNIGNIWSDESLTKSEKLEQTIGNLITIIPLALSSINILKTSAINLATSMNIAEASTWGLGAALKFLMKIPIGWIGAIVLGATLIGGFIDLITISAEEAAEAVDKARESYEESTRVLKESENQLKNIEDRIKELLALDKLTLAEEDELKKLKEEQILLKTQIELEKQLNAEKQKGLAQSIRQSIAKGNYGLVNAGDEISDFLEGNAYIDENGVYTPENPNSAGAAYLGRIVELMQSRNDLSNTELNKQISELESTFEENKDSISFFEQEQFYSWLAKLKTFSGQGNAGYNYDNFNLAEELANLEAVKADNDLNSIKVLQDTIAGYYREKNIAEFNVKQAFGEFSKEQIDNFKNDEDFTIEDLNAEELAILQTHADNLGVSVQHLINDFIYYKPTFEDALTDVEKNLAALEKQIESLKEKAKQTGELAEALKSGKELTEEQITYLQQLEKEYDGLNNILDKNSDKYIDALYQVQELQEEEATALADDKVLTLAEKIEIVADTTEFYNAMDELVNAEYEALITIKTDTKSDFDNIVSQMEDMSDLIGKIGEGFVVSAEDVSELTSAFPELLQSITYLEDGTVQLNKEQVELAKKSAKEKIQYSSEATISELEDQKQVLIGEQANYKAILKLLNAQAEGRQLTSDEEEKIDKALTDIKMTNAEAVSTVEAAALTTFAKNNAEILYETGNAVNEWAEKVNANINFAYTGIETPNVDRTFVQKKTAQVSGVDAAETRNGLIEKYKESADQKERKRQSQQEAIKSVQGIIDAYDTEIANINSYIAEIIARNNKSLTILDSIGSGFGDDGNNAEIIDLLESEYDRYRDINIVLENISKTYSKLEKQQEKLTGKDLTNNLKVQLKVLEDQNKAYQEKLNIAKRHQAELQGQLDEYGATFDASGNLTNYKTLYTNRLQEVIDSQKYYNSLNEYEQEGYKEKLEAQQESFERLEQLLSEYDDITYGTLVEIEEKTQETIDAITDAQISLFTFDIDFDIDEASFTKEFNEFKKNIIDDIAEENIFGQALAKSKNLDIYYNKDGGLVQGLTDQVLRTIQEIQEIQNTGASDVYGDNLAKAYEDLKKYNDQLMESLTDVKSTVDEIKQSYLDMMDQANEKFQEQIDMYDYIADVVNSDMSIVKLLYGEDSYSEFEKFYDILEENNKQSLDFQRQQTDFWKAQMDSAEEGSETWEKAKENWLSSVSALNTAIENSVELLIDKYSNTINKIFSDLNNKLTNGMGLEYIADEWELMNELSDQYLDNVNSGFEIRQLERKWIDSINDSALAAQSQLNALMNEQLAMLRAKDKLTQYDIDRANALYDIAVKQIALQEAQQNKSKMRLRRDSQGNYTYQYVSDEDAVAQAQQELDEAKNSMYNMDKDAYKDNLDAVYGYYEEFENKIKELYLDASITEEEREAKKLQLIEYYEPLIQGKIQENNDIRQNLQDSAQEAMGMSLDEFLMNNLIPQWDSGLQQLTNKFAEEGGFIPSCSEAMIFLEDTTRDYQASLIELQEAAGTNFAGIISSQNEVLVNVQGLVAENDALIDKYGEELVAIGSVITQVGLLIDEYEDAYRAATDATTAAYKYWKAQQEGANIAAEIKDYFYGDEIRGDGKDKREFTWQQEGSNAALQSAQETLAAANEDLKAARKEIDDLNNKVGDLEQQLSSTKGELSTAKSRISLLESRLGIGQGPGDYSPKKLLPTANKNFTQAMMFDSGGYTGSWGDTGKLAILHEKELILNQQDTTNILNAVSVARTIANVLNSISSSVRSRVAGLSSSTSFDTSSVSGFGSEIQQSITIHADFPNATDHDEIQQAFNNLLNTASQYAFRNGRG